MLQIYFIVYYSILSYITDIFYRMLQMYFIVYYNSPTFGQLLFLTCIPVKHLEDGRKWAETFR